MINKKNVFGNENRQRYTVYLHGIITRRRKIMNENITNFLDSYMLNPDPQYAVMLTGKWGCGKTYFINKWKESIDKVKNEREEVLYLNPIYISLFGMAEMEEVKREIDRVINPFKYSKPGKALKTAAKFASKIVFKTDLTKVDDVDVSISGSIDFLNLLEEKSDDVQGTRFVVFDDLERTDVPLKSLLGFVDFLVERCRFHVVLVGDESKIVGTNLAALTEFKEKIIGRQFELKPDVVAALDCFIKAQQLDEFINNESDYILACFKATGYDNLRLLRQCLYDFNGVILGIPAKERKKNAPLLHALLASFIAVYAEYNTREYHDVVSTWEYSFVQSSVNSEKNGENKNRKLVEKYHKISEGNLYEATFYGFVTNIVEYIEKGENLLAYLSTLFVQDNAYKTVEQRFSEYWLLSNQEFLGVYTAVESDLLQEKLPNLNELGRAIGFLAYFDVEGIVALKDDTMDAIKRLMDKIVSSANDLDTLIHNKNIFLGGYQYVAASTKKELNTKELIKCFLDAVDKRQKVLPNDMQLVLRSLSDENVFMLTEWDGKSAPGRGSTYQLTPIFEYENPDDLFDRLCSMSNHGRWEFADFLSLHYMLEYAPSSDRSRYKNDVPVLKALCGKVVAEIGKRECLEKKSFEEMATRLRQAIDRNSVDL